jgi:TolB-like protein
MKRPKGIRGSAVAFAAVCLLASACATAPVRVPKDASVAVWDLDDLARSGGRPDLGEFLAAQVAETVQGKGYTVVERQRLLILLEELRVGSSSLADESTRLRLGRLSGARFMVFGGYQIAGGSMRIDLRLVDVETGRIVRAAKSIAPSTGIPERVQAARSAAGELLPGS